jgi:hypothetical protein
MYGLKIFSPNCIGCLCVLLIVFFAMQKFPKEQKLKDQTF